MKLRKGILSRKETENSRKEREKRKKKKEKGYKTLPNRRKGAKKKTTKNVAGGHGWHNKIGQVKRTQYCSN